jgi:transposase
VSAGKAGKAGETARRGRGRPTKLDPTVAGLIVEALKAGNYLETAAAYAGIDKATLHRWLKDGRAGKSPELVEFCASVEKAVAHAEVIAVASITAAGKRNWQALAWRLERMHEHWRRRDRIETRQVDKDGNDAPVSGVLIAPAPVTPEEWDRLYGPNAGGTAS